MKITFIIPIYNGMKFINKCLDSIINQSYDDWEIIIINDGSTDDSQLIVENYIKSHYNYKISLINTENNGHAIARNYGMEQASGEYIWFVDVDDYLYEKDSLAKVVKHLNDFNPDVLICSVYETDFNKRNKIWHYTNKAKMITIKDMPRLVFKQNWAWNKIVKRSFLKERNIIFDRIMMFEDIYYMMELYQQAQSIYITRDICYVYVKHDAALTASLSNFKTFPKALFFMFRTYLRIKLGFNK
ncbi:MAG: glycosyltransferase [Bacilli bacterium]|jgi:glycosyltransferase involved in cell wall biosynthesis|nr:glycosyltransferase [Bacilli bacterium]